jgi:tRNA threonylcarbamoyladenosine biosynthesis protein TsaE
MLVIKSKSMESYTPTEDALADYAGALARQSQPGDIYALQGTLGAGKTSFARGFIRALVGADIDVPSPTYTLVQTYDTARGTIWHFDLYRLSRAEDVYEIGWEEALSDGICLIEWPERADRLLPPHTRYIRITPHENGTRHIQIDPA